MTGSGWPDPPKYTIDDNVGMKVVPLKGEIVADPAPKVSSRVRLSSLADVKRQIRLVYIEARNGELASGEASRFVYILTQLANLIADNELANRVETLENERDYG